MSNVRSFSRSFSGGVVTPEFWAQIGDSTFQTGLAKCRNFVTLPHGPAANRPGTQFVRKAKLGDTGVDVRLIPFEFSVTQTLALEFGAGYIRFHTLGATVLAGSPAAYNGATAYTVGKLVSSGATNYYCIAPTTGNAPPNAAYWYPLPSDAYEIPTSYAQGDLFDLHFVQSADVLTITHPSYPVRELRRLGATEWTLVDVSFAPSILAPTGTGGTATTAAGPYRDYKYVITAKNDAGEESVASAVVTLNNNLLSTGAYNDITWSATTGAVRYSVYLQSNGLYGYIGETDALTFTDDNITPDLAKTPPINDNPFGSTSNYPRAVSYFEQRRVFAGTTNKPQNLWMTRTGTESNLNYSIPTRDDDRVAFRISARQVNTVLHAVPLVNLVLLSNAAEWRVSSVSSDAITPTSLSVKPQSYVGSSNVQPVVVNNNILFAAARGGHLREMAYDNNAGGYITGDLSLRAPHLFARRTIKDMAYSKAPFPIVWVVSSSGRLLTLTYIPEQRIGAWHYQDTGEGDTFVSVCVVTEGDDDAVYVAVKRTIGGNVKTYVERFAARQYPTLEDEEDETAPQYDLVNSVFLDSSLTYTGTAATTVTGLGHLEGRTVSILGDGAVFPDKVVTGGTVTLDNPASTITVGLPIEADLQTLPLVYQGEAFGQGRVKNVDKVWLRLYRSSGVQAGPTFSKLAEYKQRSNEPLGTPPTLVSDEISLTLPPSWQSGGQVCVRHSSPTPLTISSVTLAVTVGG